MMAGGAQWGVMDAACLAVLQCRHPPYISICAFRNLLYPRRKFRAALRLWEKE
ncbi:hypothetical protein E2C01_097664 [Portunus trituberculatus]|uniref:Uncharacterized protein n=1 Tax=Portunus trituberculatus TaxID=210409 RepID=A0A5B7K5F5_PORTR|nr:hypothetical protein [Portunus trituberculatus]